MNKGLNDAIKRGLLRFSTSFNVEVQILAEAAFVQLNFRKGMESVFPALSTKYLNNENFL